jgi:predicted DNA-binding transcriptional regulator AlpA
METLFIPNENDFRKWIRDAVKETFEVSTIKYPEAGEKEEPLISRRDIAGYLGISLVTLTDWMKKGLPFHRLNGRVYFQKSEVLEYIKSKRKKQL